MPLFFAISGYFAAKHVHRSWRLVCNKRILSPYYLYVVWFLLHSLFVLLDLPLNASKAETSGEFFLGLIFGFTSLWYLYALPVYFMVAKLLSKWPLPTLMGAALISLATNFFSIIGNGESLIKNLIFFLIAAYYPHTISNWSQKISRRSLLYISGAFVITSGFLVSLTHAVTNQGVTSFWVHAFLRAAELPLGLLGVLFGIAVFVSAARRLPLFTSCCAFVGSRTLSIYVLHLPVLAVLNTLFLDTQPAQLIVIAYPLLAVPLVVCACLLTHRLLILIRANWLFRAPWSSASGKLVALVKTPNQ